MNYGCIYFSKKNGSIGKEGAQNMVAETQPEVNMRTGTCWRSTLVEVTELGSTRSRKRFHANTILENPKHIFINAK